MSFFVSGGLELVLEVSFLSQNLILEATSRPSKANCHNSSKNLSDGMKD
jgi:hypothetical protein